MFTGEYHHAVDDKGRVAVPARFRAELAGGALVSKWIDGCLAISPRAAWDALAARAATLPVTDAGARTFQRFIFGTAFDADLDRQGRVVVPAVLREFAGLEGGGRGGRLSGSPGAVVAQALGRVQRPDGRRPRCSPNTSRASASSAEPDEPPGSGGTAAER